jgi:hypothetical protein
MGGRDLRRAITVALAILTTVTLPVPSFAQGRQGDAPHTLVLRGDVLARAKARVAAKDPALLPAFNKLRNDAERELKAPIVAVTDKRSLLPPSGDKHDYFSLSPYWWPDPAKADGLPYIRRDGETNPESKKDLDRPRLGAMVENVNTLALAWYFTGDERYAARAGKQLRAWFLDADTRMTPHLHYGQLVRGNPKERGSAIIDTHNFIDVVDDAQLLVSSASWAKADHEALKAWMKQYNTWLLESENGKDEWDAPNNHGSWYAAQTATLALFSGDTARTRQIASDAKARIGSQIKPDGQQPIELERTRSMHYSGFNADALSRLAELGRWVGVDLWHYESPEGGSLRKAIDHLANYVARPKDWPGKQIDAVEPGFIVEVMRRAQVALGSPIYEPVIATLPESVTRTERSVLLYPDK